MLARYHFKVKMSSTTENQMENQERETTKITLPISGTVVEHYTYLKAKEVRDLGKHKEPDASVKYLIETLVLTVNDSKENIYETLMELRYQDYKALDASLMELVKDLSEKKA